MRRIVQLAMVVLTLSGARAWATPAVDRCLEMRKHGAKAKTCFEG